MKTAFKVIWILTILLSTATGVFKLLQQEADILLFAKIGFDTTMTTVLGAIQVLGGLLLIPASTRKIGAVVMVATFILAAVAVFANGMIAFGIVSLVFVAMAASVLLMEARA